MAMNRVQFQPGLSLPQFLARYGQESACHKALLQARWPQGFVCPHCHCQAHSRFERGDEPIWQCTACRRQCSLRSGTIFASTKLPLRTWLLALYLLSQSKTNLSALELKRHLGVCYRTAWRLKHKLMQAMHEREAGRKLGGLVQIDDAYLGGERNGGKAGRGSENKRPFVIALSTTDDNRPRYVVMETVEGFTKTALSQWMERRLYPGSDVYSDGLGAFRAAEEQGHAHTVIEASGREATQQKHSQWLNVVLGNVKRAVDGTYHAFKYFKYAHRYLSEAAWRFNRRFDLAALVPRLLVAAARAKRWTEKELREVPVYDS